MRMGQSQAERRQAQPDTMFQVAATSCSVHLIWQQGGAAVCLLERHVGSQGSDP